MKKILVLGATGAMGFYLVPELAKCGYSIDAVSLDDPPYELPNVTYHKFNAKEDVTLFDFIKVKRYDAILDLLLYRTNELKSRYLTLLDSTDHYIFFSSYRVYANEESPIKETSPRLLDVSDDNVFLSGEESKYALYKAREEDLILTSGRSNYTILRPTMVFSRYRYQLVGLEAPTFLYLAQEGKKVVLPENAMSQNAAMIWSGDVAKLVSRLVLNKKAYGEIFTVGSSENHTWKDIANYYKEAIGLEYYTVSCEEYEKYLYSVCADWVYDHKYDRYFDRRVDNSKILMATGMTPADIRPLGEGLAHELHSLPTDFKWKPYARTLDMIKFFNL